MRCWLGSQVLTVEIWQFVCIQGDTFDESGLMTAMRMADLEPPKPTAAPVPPAMPPNSDRQIEVLLTSNDAWSMPRC